MSASETAAGAASSPRWMPRGLLGDARLARLAAAGDPRAFETIFERYNAELYRYCRAILGNSDDAQDALQSTMTNALRSLPGDDRRIALRPWLYRVAHNESISIVRQRASGADLDQVPDAVSPGADLEAEVRERLKTLVADLDALPDRQRGALVMRELSGLSYSEIGTALGASDGAARQAVYEARLSLQELKTGREMECETARRALSEGDGRALRGRRLRAHVRACQSCRDFEAGISQRRSDLRALCPPLPALAASGLLTVLLGEAGGGGAATGALGGSSAGLVGAAGTSAAVKGASIAAAVAIGAGAAGVSGAVDVPLVGHGHASPVTQVTPASQRAADAARGASPTARAPAGTEAASSAAARRHGAASQGAHARAHHARAAGARAHGHGNASVAHGKPANPGNGNSSAASNGTPPGHSASGDSPGNSGNAGNGGNAGNSGNSGASGGSPGNSAHSSAGGSSNSKAPASPPGLERAAANAPTLPEQAHGKPGSPPGHGSTSHGNSSHTS